MIVYLKPEENNISLGPFYRIPSKNNLLVRFWSFSPTKVKCTTEENKTLEISPKEAFKLAVLAPDIHDWPNLALTDPKLAYSYDLLWDCKRPSELLQHMQYYPNDTPSILEVLKEDTNLSPEPKTTPGSPFAKLLALIKTTNEKL